MFTKDSAVDLTNICDGAAVEKFEIELAKVVRDILDPNTDPKAKRKVVLEFTFMPDENRELGQIAVRSKTVLAGHKAHVVSATFGRSPLGFEAREFKKMGDLFGPKVTPINGEELKQ
jgi:hypothetical protein